MQFCFPSKVSHEVPELNSYVTILNRRLKSLQFVSIISIASDGQFSELGLTQFWHKVAVACSWESGFVLRDVVLSIWWKQRAYLDKHVFRSVRTVTLVFVSRALSDGD